ncbi:MAG: dicarboxylate/amino acid:cation symporter [Kofleriaceae bacterium]
MKVPSIPLYVRVIIAVALGSIVGVIAGTGDVVPGVTTGDLGKLGLLVIRMLKMLAVPLVLFAVLDAIARSSVNVRQGLRLVVICLVNVSVAFTIGLALMNTLRPGDEWRGHIQELSGLTHEQLKKAPEGTTLSPLDNLQKWVPESLAQPFEENNVIAIVLLAILGGAAIRRVRDEAEKSDDAESKRAIGAVIDGIAGGYRVLMRMLTWVVEIVPYGVFCVVAMTIGKAGFDTFGVLGGFLGVILLGFVIHSLGYYPLMAWLVGGKSPLLFFGKGGNAIVTGLSMNSSLATMPITLKSLEAMGVSQESARLSACIGTNLNNDGITLYEAMTAVFLAQALGYDLSFGAQITIVLASLMAGIGIAGVPEAGLIVLPLVLHAAGLPEQLVAALIPLIFTVDWILARARSAVNVMADMLVAILLDRWARARGETG